MVVFAEGVVRRRHAGPGSRAPPTITSRAHRKIVSGDTRNWGGPRRALHFSMRLLMQLAPADTGFRYQGGGVPKGIVMIIALVMVYVLPTLLAWKRQSSRLPKIALINLLFGWTVIGWIVAMVLTFAYEHPPEGSAPDVDHVPALGRRE